MPFGTLMPTLRPRNRNIPKAGKGSHPWLKRYSDLDPGIAYKEVALGFGKFALVGERLSPPWYDQRPARYGEG